jgi:hypothetical protein
MSNTILKQDAIAIIEAASKHGAWASSHVAVGHVIEAINEMPSEPDTQVTALVEAARFYMSQFGQALEANEIEYGPSHIEADKRLRVAITTWEQSK